MPSVVLFFEEADGLDGLPRRLPANRNTEIHVFPNSFDALDYSRASLHRPHLVRHISGDRWHAAFPKAVAPPAPGLLSRARSLPGRLWRHAWRTR